MDSFNFFLQLQKWPEIEIILQMKRFQPWSQNMDPKRGHFAESDWE